MTASRGERTKGKAQKFPTLEIPNLQDAFLGLQHILLFVLWAGEITEMITHCLHSPLMFSRQCLLFPALHQNCSYVISSLLILMVKLSLLLDQSPYFLSNWRYFVYLASKPTNSPCFSSTLLPASS